MNALLRQTRAAVDLGLLTRVLCHELNNLIANQRGYARLLTQNPAGGNAPRWVGELAGSAEELQRLVAAVQHWTRQAASDGAAAGRAALQWPPPPEVAGLAAELTALGCALSEAGLCRILAVVADEAGTAASQWQRLEHGSAPGHGAVLGVADPGTDMLGVVLPDASAGACAARWAEAAGHILPPAGGSADAWLRALALGLLRQSGAGLYHLPGPAARIELWLPAGAVPLAETGFGA